MKAAETKEPSFSLNEQIANIKAEVLQSSCMYTVIYLLILLNDQKKIIILYFYYTTINLITNN